MKINNKKVLLIVGLILIGILLIFLGNKSQNSNSKNQAIDYESYTKALEKKIENFLLSIDGINKANVIITLDTLNEQFSTKNQITYDFLSNNSKSEEALTNTNELFPTVKGIAIACTNGNSDDVKVKVTRLIVAYLGISSNRIEIVGIK